MKNQLIINNKEVELSPESWKAMEEQFGKKSFYPEDEEDFFLISFLEAEALVLIQNYDNGFKTDFDCGLAFKTRPEAEAKLAEMQATTKIRKFIFEEGLSFEPDWSDGRQEKWNIVLVLEGNIFKGNLNRAIKTYSPFGHLKSEKDCEKVIESCKEELKIIFKIKK